MTTVLQRCGLGIVVLFLGLLASGASKAVAAGQIVADSVESTVLGTFRGVQYVRYTGRFAGSGSAGDYMAPFELTAPANLKRGNRRLVVEPFHFGGGALVRDRYLTPEFLFGRRFSHAGICYKALI